MVQKLRAALDRRLGGREFTSRAGNWFKKELERKVPGHAGWCFTLGWAIGAAFLALCFSGLLLLFYYRPTDKEAYESIVHIVDNVRFGWLMLQVHRWSSHLIVGFFVLYLLRDFWFGAYKAPRDWVWALSVILFMVTLTFGFTGRVLPWDQHAFHATVIATEIMKKGIYFFGNYAAFAARGGEVVSGETLTRFFVLHVVMIPPFFIGLFLLRAILARSTGPAPLASVTEEEEKGYAQILRSGRPIYPGLLSRQVTMFLLALLLVVTCSIYWPLPLDEKADPGHIPDLLKPEWYFLALHQLTKYFPTWFCAWIGLIVPGLLVVFPLFDRSKERRPSRRKGLLALAGLVLIATVLLSFIGYISGRERTYFGQKYKWTMKGVPVKVDGREKGSQGPVPGGEE